MPRVDFSYECRECRRLSGTGWSADEDKAARQFGQERNVVSEVQIARARNAHRQGPYGCGRAPAFAVQVHAKTPESFEREPHVDRFTDSVAFPESRGDHW
jgi:hypothetical protein